MSVKYSLWLSVCCLSLLSACDTQAQQTNLSVAEFEMEIKQDKIQILDVRTAGEYRTGHLENSMLANWNDEKEFKERVRSLDKKIPVYTYCLSGGRSGAATQWLNQNGFTAFNLTGGISAWKKAGKPVKEIEKVQQMTMEDYRARISKNKTVLVDFGAEWCPPCKKMDPVIDSLVKTNGAQFELVKINGGNQTDISKELNINALPTFIIYKEGKEVWRKEGLTELNEFVSQL